MLIIFCNANNQICPMDLLMKSLNIQKYYFPFGKNPYVQI